MWKVVIVWQVRSCGRVHAVCLTCHSRIALLVESQTHAHNHQTSRALSNSYVISESLAAVAPVMNDVARMVDSRVSTKVIVTFISDELGE